jgi:hypothetical protein
MIRSWFSEWRQCDPLPRSGRKPDFRHCFVNTDNKKRNHRLIFCAQSPIQTSVQALLQSVAALPLASSAAGCRDAQGRTSTFGSRRELPEEDLPRFVRGGLTHQSKHAARPVGSRSCYAPVRAADKCLQSEHERPPVCAGDFPSTRSRVKHPALDRPHLRMPDE